MGAFVLERPHLNASRVAPRGCVRFVVALTSLCLFTAGCRSVKSVSDSAGTATLGRRIIADSTSSKNELKVHNSSAKTKRTTISTSSAGRPDWDGEEPADRETNSAEDDDEQSSSKTPRNRTADAIVQTNAVSANAANVDRSESFIKILSFQVDDPKKDQAPLDITDYPKELPPSPDDVTKSLRLTFPSQIPGATAPRIELPETDDEHPGGKSAAIDFIFPAPPALKSLPTPTERTMTLDELEELALQNNPIIAQALASITVNQGTAIQQGIYPNPVFGYEADTVGSSFTRDYQGVYVSQLVKTGGKLSLQRAAANMDSMNSQLAYERTKLEVLRLVRAGYYNVLVAQEAMRINEALLQFTNQVYSLMIDRLKKGEQAAYELSQLQSLVIQARGTLVQAQNRYISAWKQLAIATGIRDLRPALLEGRVDMPVPNLDFDALLERVLTVHPDVQASRNLEAQSRIQLKLQRTIPIPDVTVAGALQNDSTTPGYQRTSYNLNVSVPVPIYDRNQGNIKAALGKVQLNSQQYAVATNQLTNQLADAFERYQTSRVQAEYYRTQILPDLARAYRGVYERHISNSTKVAFGDIIVAQQNLAGGVSNYITALLTQWVAMTDIANLIQLQDFDEILTNTPAVYEPPQAGLPSPSPREGGTP